MRSIALILLILASGCSQAPREPLPRKRTENQVISPNYLLPAFGGRLLGTDHGEWIGELLFQDETGGIETVLDENVHGIVQNPAGIFVFTGLHHMNTNEGYIYSISLDERKDVVATRLGRIPGAPSDVTQHTDGTTTFLVATDRYDHKGRLVYECYELTGKMVKSSLDCLPPRPLGANNSFKPKPLRGSA